MRVCALQLRRYNQLAWQLVVATTTMTTYGLVTSHIDHTSRRPPGLRPAHNGSVLLIPARCSLVFLILFWKYASTLVRNTYVVRL